MVLFLIGYRQNTKGVKWMSTLKIWGLSLLSIALMTIAAFLWENNIPREYYLESNNLPQYLIPSAEKVTAVTGATIYLEPMDFLVARTQGEFPKQWFVLSDDGRKAQIYAQRKGNVPALFATTLSSSIPFFPTRSNSKYLETPFSQGRTFYCPFFVCVIFMLICVFNAVSKSVLD